VGLACARIDKSREILLIEDSKFIRIAVQRALTGAEYTVHTANHAEAGLGAARETLPDLIVLDLVLPTISGLDVLKALKRDAITKSIPVIVLATFSERTKEELINEGAAACVEKSEKLFESDSVALIHTVTQVVAEAKASRG
jgi:CheY-like chemotaxis protein